MKRGQPLFGNNFQSRNCTGIWGMQPRRRNVHQPWETPLIWEEGEEQDPSLGAGDILQCSPSLLHNRPDIPSPRKQLRTKPLDHLESTFQAMGWMISQPSSVRCSGAVTMSPNIPKYHTTHILYSKRSPGTRPSYGAGKLPVLPQGEAQREIRC